MVELQQFEKLGIYRQGYRKISHSNGQFRHPVQSVL